jgi:hypothetical protein
MFRWISRPARRSKMPGRAARAVRPGLERLETRDCPAAPSLTVHAFDAGGNQLEVVGRVRDEHPGTTIVHITGAAQGDAHPDATGYFRVFLPQTGPGAVEGQAVDDQGLPSKTTETSSFGGYNQPPTVMYEIGQRGGHQVLIQGYVTDDGPVGGLPVVFRGVVSGTAITNADGTFTITLTASSLGWMCANAQDDDGAWSGDYWVELQNLKPEILGLRATQGTGGWWVLSGTVNDEWPSRLIVVLQSSIPDLNGRQVKCGSTGAFSTSFTLPPGFQSGIVIATVTDWWGATSDPVFTLIF